MKSLSRIIIAGLFLHMNCYSVFAENQNINQVYDHPKTEQNIVKNDSSTSINHNAGTVASDTPKTADDNTDAEKKHNAEIISTDKSIRSVDKEYADNEKVTSSDLSEIKSTEDSEEDNSNSGSDNKDTFTLNSQGTDSGKISVIPDQQNISPVPADTTVENNVPASDKGTQVLQESADHIDSELNGKIKTRNDSAAGKYQNSDHILNYSANGGSVRGSEPEQRIINNYIVKNENQDNQLLLLTALLVISLFFLTVMLLISKILKTAEINNSMIKELKQHNQINESLCKCIENIVDIEAINHDHAKENSSAASGSNDCNLQEQHELIKVIANRLAFIKVTLSKMDPDTRGYRQLKKSVEQIYNNIKVKNYEILDYLNEPYNDGMKATANFVEDDNLPKGTQIITGVTKPQINYQGEMIQSAEIIVSQNN